MDRARQWVRRAAGSDGHERHMVELVGKSSLAALGAWLISYYVLSAQSPAFAPFSAVLIMQVTVYRSALQALRYVAAVSAGVVLQGLLGLLAGPGPLTFALVALAALIIGRWRHLGAQGSQVATAAFFAFSLYVSATDESRRWMELGQIVLLVLVGCAVGMLVNVLVLPPMRYRSAEYGVHTVARSLCDLLGDVHPALREGELTPERTGQWRRRAAQLGPIAEQAQSAVQTAWEGTYYHPRRLFTRDRRHLSFSGYQAVVDALERVCQQVQSMTRSLDQAHADDGDEHDESDESAGASGERSFLRRYGELLGALAHITELFSEVDEDRLSEQSDELSAAAADAQEKRNRLTENAERGALPLSDLSRPYSILLVEAVRLTDELQHTCDVLRQGVEEEEEESGESGD